MNYTLLWALFDTRLILGVMVQENVTERYLHGDINAKTIYLYRTTVREGCFCLFICLFLFIGFLRQMEFSV